MRPLDSPPESPPRGPGGGSDDARQEAASPLFAEADAPPAGDDDAAGLARDLRAARLGRGLRTRELAQRAGVSASLVSQIETGRTTPSIGTLRLLAAALEVPVATFFRDDGDHAAAAQAVAAEQRAPDQTARPLGRVVRAHRRKHLYLPESAIRYELLTPDLTGKIEFVWAELAPHQPQLDLMSHSGEEVILVLSGTLHVWLDQELHVLEQGDSITFDSAIPHRVENPGPERNIHLSAITPPSF